MQRLKRKRQPKRKKQIHNLLKMMSKMFYDIIPPKAGNGKFTRKRKARIFQPGFGIIKTSIVKVVALLVILSLNWSGLSAVIETISYYFDNEGDGGNIFTAATLDFEIDAGSWSGTPSEMKPGDSVAKHIVVNQEGSLGFKYIVEAEETSGNHAFCSALEVVAERNGSTVQGPVPLLSLSTTEVTYDSPSVDFWDFTVTLPSGSFPMESCGFKFVFTGWQTDFLDASSGFSDIEEDANTLIGAQGQACDPDDVTLPTDFDQAYWIDKANDGGVVNGSFVFPSNTTGLQLGPTEIIGDLTFGQNNTATIKGPIYVHGDLDIASGTTITQDSSFGDNFVAIIIEGTITIADDVEFVGSGTTGAVLLVSTKTTGTVIDVLAGTVPTGNLGDAVLFATNGNIHIGSDRTVLDAYITTTGSSGPTGPLSPSTGTNVTGVGNTAWTDTGNVISDNNFYATVTLPNSSAVSNYLRSTDYGFAIPNGATINGIEVTIGRYSSSNSGYYRIQDNVAKLVKTGTVVGDNKAVLGTNWTGSEMAITYGGASDTWGTTWTPNDINNTNFGAVLSVLNATGVSWSYSAYVDYINIKVYWAIAGQTITLDSGTTIQHGTLPPQVACGPMFAPLDGVVINEFVPNVPDTGLSGTLIYDGFGTGSTDSDVPNWEETGDTEAYEPTSGDDSVSPDGGRFARIGEDDWICREVDATGYSDLAISYYWRGDSDAESSDDGIIEYFTGGNCNSPSGLSSLATYDLDNTSWSSLQSINLPGVLNNTSFFLRFRTSSSQSSEHFRVDGVEITGEIAPGSYSTNVMSPTTNSIGTGNGWANASDAYADGGGAATDNEGDKHLYGNFGFNIPNGANINGIEVYADASSSGGTTDTGFKNPSANAYDTGGDDDGFESNPDDAYTNGSGAAANYNGAGDRHRFYGYDFSSLPFDAGISGIEVRLDWWLENTSDDNSMSVQLSWDGGTSWTSVQTNSAESTNDTNNKVLGDSSNTWGRTWFVSNFSADNFRVRAISNSDNRRRDFFLDWIPVKVYYTVPTSPVHLGVDLSWNGGSTWTSMKTTTDLTSSELTYTLGGTVDTWGQSWTVSQLSDGNFVAEVTDVDTGTTVNLDWLRAKVYYTVGGEQGSPGEPHDGEWVELYNGTGAIVDVDGWALYDAENTHELIISDANTDTGDTLITTGGYLVVYRDGDADFDLDNTSDTIRLYDDQSLTVEHLVDSHSYNYLGGAPENKSFARVPDGTANWVDPEPTPGEPNNMFVVPYVEEIEELEIIEEEIIPEEETPIEEELLTEENQEEGIVGEINDTIEEMVSGLFEEIIPDEATNEEPATEEIPAVDETSVIEEVPNTEETEETPVTEEQPVIEENTPVIEEQPVTAPENTAVEGAAPEADGGDGAAGNETEGVSE